MKFTKPTLKPSYFFILLFITYFIYISYQINELAAEPNGVKDCNYTIQDFRNSAPAFMQFEELSIPSSLQITNRNGKINDASCLNETTIWGIAKVKNKEEISQAIVFAKQNNLKITPYGSRHSMGGQSFLRGGLSMDFSNMKNISLDEASQTVTLDPGVTWGDLLKFVDERGYAVQVMQAYDVFSVAASISVNGHGLNLNPSHVGDTVVALSVTNPEGKLEEISPVKNNELFENVIGGYGLFGVISEVKLKVVKNENYKVVTENIKLSDLESKYENEIKDNPDVVFSYGSMSVSPFSFFDEIILYKYEHSDVKELDPISKNGPTQLTRLVVNFSKTGPFGKFVKSNLEKYLPYDTRGLCVTRNNSITGENQCIISHNQAMNGNLNFLKNNLPDTDILQEYFIPKSKFTSFITGLRDVVSRDGTNLLNGAIRFVHKDEVSKLAYSRKDSFAIVLYFNQKLNDTDSEKLKQTTSHLIDLAIENGGSFYLPYQLYYSKDQLTKAYPQFDNFVSSKKNFDPSEIFSNTWFEKYK